MRSDRRRQGSAAEREGPLESAPPGSRASGGLLWGGVLRVCERLVGLGCSWRRANASVRRWAEALLDADTERVSDVETLRSTYDTDSAEAALGDGCCNGSMVAPAQCAGSQMRP